MLKGREGKLGVEKGRGGRWGGEVDIITFFYLVGYQKREEEKDTCMGEWGESKGV